MTVPDEVDIIVCGGGSCGCVVAGRLANLDHNLQVLLIEAGESNLNNPWVYRPGKSLRFLLGPSLTELRYLPT